MNPTHPIGPSVRRFLVEEVATDRGLSPNTQKSYRDTVYDRFNSPVLSRFSRIDRSSTETGLRPHENAGLEALINMSHE